ncbi:MAG: hypothetical protein ACK56I_01480, partial [bacterium]
DIFCWTSARSSRIDRSPPMPFRTRHDVIASQSSFGIPIFRSCRSLRRRRSHSYLVRSYSDPASAGRTLTSVNVSKRDLRFRELIRQKGGMPCWSRWQKPANGFRELPASTCARRKSDEPES